MSENLDRSARKQGDLWSAVDDDWAELLAPAVFPVWGPVLDLARVARDSRVLDAGCGSGDVLAERETGDRNGDRFVVQTFIHDRSPGHATVFRRPCDGVAAAGDGVSERLVGHADQSPWKNGSTTSMGTRTSGMRV